MTLAAAATRGSGGPGQGSGRGAGADASQFGIWRRTASIGKVFSPDRALAFLKRAALGSGPNPANVACTQRSSRFYRRKAVKPERSVAGSSGFPAAPPGSEAVPGPYLAGVTRGWPFSGIQNPMSFAGASVLAFLALWISPAGLYPLSPALRVTGGCPSGSKVRVPSMT